ncbi:hypothetical protein [Legionella pneumophila]|uniref:hypothetical protein n=1 Tax=Legionella pneumophila TaxID=446 RepID=UPI00224499FD|nr:hypothetical protein [Legionella pneumophila]MCW8436827.1 hypothetical protein [Legionella pneumophila]MCW8479179.1 hypothetical protein [Legionella pneumophila]HDV5710282.1 hypothetical protein [Legionella pneumophila]HDV5806050.1 hypothetical protein [Legionella pneumophila]
MDKIEKLVRDAVDLARKRGVEFEDGTPSFRSNGQESIFRIVININTRPDTAGHGVFEKDFKYLENHNMKSLADYLVREFNKLNIIKKAK